MGCTTGNWDTYFDVLDAVLNAGPQGEPWSVDTVADGTARFVEAGGLLESAAQEFQRKFKTKAVSFPVTSVKFDVSL